MDCRDLDSRDSEIERLRVALEEIVHAFKTTDPSDEIMYYMLIRLSHTNTESH